MSCFANRAAKILMVDPTGVTRAMLSQALRSLGFTSFRAAKGIEDALSSLGDEPTDWIITSLFASDPLNAIHLLKACAEQPKLKSIRISLIVEETETYCLGLAFASGLLSFHKKPFTAESLKKDFEDLISTLDAWDWDTCLASAEFLRSWLRNTQQHTSLLTFENELLKLHSNRPSLLLKLAEAQILAGKEQEGRQTLLQAKMLGGDLEREAQALEQRYLGETQSSPTAIADKLGLKSCVIIDPDETVRTFVRDLLTQELKVSQVEDFARGDTAWEWVAKNPEPSLIVHEWRLPGLSGPAFIQRVRGHGYQTVPFLCISSLIQRTDEPLAQEMGIFGVVPKPFNKPEFLNAIISAMQQHQTPTTRKAAESRMRQLLAASRKRDALAIKTRYLSDPKIPPSSKKLVEAEFAYFDKQFTRARDLCVEAIKEGERTVFAYHRLGSCLAKLRDFDGALKCLERAKTLSPQNIERLCAIAEMQLETGAHEQARATLNEALTLDPKNAAVQQAVAVNALRSGGAQETRKVWEGLESLTEVIAYMNNRAVALARSGELRQAIELYRNALDRLPDKHASVKPILQYNLALAFLRVDQFEEAADLLTEAVRAKSKVSSKATALLKKVETARSTGQPLILTTTDNEPEATHPFSATNPSLEIAPGEVCCHLIFQAETSDKNALRLLTCDDDKLQRAVARATA